MSARPRRLRGARVCLDGMLVGRIEETHEGTRFTYAPAYLARSRPASPISLTMPLRPEPYESKGGLLTFFENLLPEGWLLELSTAKLKIPKDDAFGLLLATCADCIGAVEVVPEHSGGGEGEP